VTMNLNFIRAIFEKKTSIATIFPLLILLNIINLILGLVSNTVLAAKFGAGTLKDGIELSLSTSRNMVTSFGIGSLGGSALYVVARLSSKKPDQINGYISSVFLLQFMYSLLFFGALRVFAEPIVNLMSPGMPADIRGVAIGSITWAAWIILLQPVADLLGAANTGLQIYGTIQIGTILQKICLLVGILCTDLFGPIAYPAGNTIGLVLCIVLLAKVLASSGFKFSTRVSFKSTEIRQSLKLSVPWVMAAPLLNIASWVIIPIMIGLGPGQYSSYLYSNVLYTMVIAVVITPFSDGLSPMLARCAALTHEGAAGGLAEEGSLISLGFRVSFMLGVLVAALAVVASRPLVGLILFKGAMDLNSASQISKLFCISSIGLASQSVTIFLCRLFQAKISMTSYILSQLVSPLVMLPLVFLLVGRMGIYAIATGMTLSSMAGGWLSLVLARRLVGRHQLRLDRNLVLWAILMVIAAAGVLCFPVAIERPFALNLINLLLVGLSTVSLAWLAAYLMRLPEHEIITRLITDRLGRASIWKPDA
jgi:putative peptidoglycan lipid II flippase